AGPDFPNIGGKTLGAKDAPACLLPNGRVLLVGGPVDGVSGDYLSPTYFFEFDGSSLTQVASPPNNGGPPFTGRMLLLPTGEVLFASGSNAIYCYSPGGTPDASWRPSITSAPSSVRQGFGYTLHGRQLNGLSQAVAYGDDAAMATNYPLLRIRNIATGHVTYCRSHDHSSMGVGTGTAIHSTNFEVPVSTPIGPSELTVIANGISSTGVTLNVEKRFKFDWHIYETWAWLIGSLADGPLWVWGPHGPVPVDPMGNAKLIKEAKQARAEMLQGMKALAELGKEAARLRIKQAEAVPPAVEDDE
ncbi:MAG TPA: hypothetical protein VNG33_24190, partial [Polyangiaceae bacterium]|nr:hypothetical protein [Polyangiaceae bacterium]